jgi:hypothetical protein
LTFSAVFFLLTGCLRADSCL